MENLRIFAFADEAGGSIEHQIAAMQRNGLDGLEIRNVDGVNVSDMTAAHAREVRGKLDDAGLITWSIGSPIGKIGAEEDFGPHLDKFRHTLEIADILGAENIRMFSFYIPEDRDPAAFRDTVFERLDTLIGAAAGSGVALCHENEKLIYGDMAVRCAEIHREFPALKAVFDPANFIQCGQETWEAWTLLKPFVKYLHIKDAMPDGNVVPAGKGCGCVARILSDFLADGGRALTVEPHLKVFDGLADLERSGGESGIGGYCYESNDAAFDAACGALKDLLKEDGR